LLHRSVILVTLLSAAVIAAPLAFDIPQGGGWQGAFAKNGNGGGNGNGNSSGHSGNGNGNSSGNANSSGNGNSSGNANDNADGGAASGVSEGDGIGISKDRTGKPAPLDAVPALWLQRNTHVRRERARTESAPIRQAQRAIKAPRRLDRDVSAPMHAARTFLTTGLSEAAISRLAARGFEVEARTKGTLGPKVVTVRAPRGFSLERARQLLEETAPLAAVDLDHFYYPDGAPPDCTGSTCASFSLVGWNSEELGRCGPLPLIGMVDTEIDRDNPALVGQSLEVIRGAASAAQAGTAHGTAIAALLVGRSDSTTPGLFPQGRLLAVSAFEHGDDGSDRMDAAGLVAAIETLVERGVGVINLSLSGPPNKILEQAVASAYERGVVLVAAAGNEGPGAAPSYPGAYSDVVAVTAVDRDLNIYRRATAGDYVDLAGPGVNLWTATSASNHGPSSGTSYAVPFVTAAAALLRAANRDLSPGEVLSGISLTAQDLGPAGRDPVFGWGLVQPARLCMSPQQRQERLKKASIASQAPSKAPRKHRTLWIDPAGE
jgi:hypothetical protein